MKAKTWRLFDFDSDTADYPKCNLVLGSPPYATKFSRYGMVEKPDWRDWAKWMFDHTLKASLVCSGYVIWVVDSPRVKGEYVPAVELLKIKIAECEKLKLYTTQIWYKNGAPGGPYYPGHDYEQVVVASAADLYPKYNPEAIGTPKLFRSGPGSQRRANGSRGKAKRGTSKDGLARPKDVVRFTVGKNSMGRVGPKGTVITEDDMLATAGEAPYPWKLASHYVRGYSNVGDTVFDPFSGTGTTVLAATCHGRIGIGYDVRKSQNEIAEKRLQLFLKSEQ